MKLDNTLLRILTTIQEEVKDKYKVELSIQELFEVVNTQIEATKLGFSRGVTIYWERFCKFVYTDRKTHCTEVRRLRDELAGREDLTSQEKEQLLKEKIIEKAIRKKALINKDSGLEKGQSLDKVLENPIIHNTKIMLFNNITKKK